MRNRRFRSEEFVRGCYGRAAFLCRYLHAPLSEVLGLTREQSDRFQEAIVEMVNKENGG